MAEYPVKSHSEVPLAAVARFVEEMSAVGINKSPEKKKMRKNRTNGNPMDRTDTRQGRRRRASA